MNNKRVSIFNILLPIFLLSALMAIALINYPVIFDKSKGAVITVFAAIVVYALLWALIRPDSFSKNAGLFIGFLFIINISVEEFINWQTKTSSLISTLTMMFVIFISFSIISAIKTLKTQNIYEGIKSSFISALSGTMIALCFGFLINYLFANRMVNILRNYPGFKAFSNPKAFPFFNAFDNASSHVVIAPIVSIIMAISGGVVALLILRLRKRKQL